MAGSGDSGAASFVGLVPAPRPASSASRGSASIGCIACSAAGSPAALVGASVTRRCRASSGAAGSGIGSAAVADRPVRNSPIRAGGDPATATGSRTAGAFGSGAFPAPDPPGTAAVIAPAPDVRGDPAPPASAGTSGTGFKAGTGAWGPRDDPSSMARCPVGAAEGTCCAAGSPVRPRTAGGSSGARGIPGESATSCIGRARPDQTVRPDRYACRPASAATPVTETIIDCDRASTGRRSACADPDASVLVAEGSGTMSERGAVLRARATAARSGTSITLPRLAEGRVSAKARPSVCRAVGSGSSPIPPSAGAVEGAADSGSMASVAGPPPGFGRLTRSSERGSTCSPSRSTPLAETIPAGAAPIAAAGAGGTAAGGTATGESFIPPTRGPLTRGCPVSTAGGVPGMPGTGGSGTWSRSERVGKISRCGVPVDIPSGASTSFGLPDAAPAPASGAEEPMTENAAVERGSRQPPFAGEETRASCGRSPAPFSSGTTSCDGAGPSGDFSPPAWTSGGTAGSGQGSPSDSGMSP